jgi:serine/threonine-protein kinase
MALGVDRPAARIGRFTVEEEIARTATGIVYRGTHPGLRLPVAIKVFRGSIVSDPGFAERFKRDTATIVSLNHPAIVRVFDVTEHMGSLCIVTEYLDAQSLRGHLVERRRLEEPMALDLMRQLLDAVGAAHEAGVLHGHLKPETIFVDEAGHAKVAEFGISHVLHDSSYVAGAGGLIHTGAYLAPEQVLGNPPSVRSDVYALGALLYEALHGLPPFSGEVPAVLHAHLHEQPRVSPYISNLVFPVIWRALAKAPQERFVSCADFAGALRDPSLVDATLPAPEAPRSENRLGFKLPFFGR